jgi:hypothetical protein
MPGDTFEPLEPYVYPWQDPAAQPGPVADPQRPRWSRPPKGPRGGRRPGAGAPKGNFNALKTGDYARRLTAASWVAVLVPEVADAFRYLSKQADLKQRREFLDVLAETYKGMQQDPGLAKSIKELFLQRINEVLEQKHMEATLADLFPETIIQSKLRNTRRPTRKAPGKTPGGLS